MPAVVLTGFPARRTRAHGLKTLGGSLTRDRVPRRPISVSGSYRAAQLRHGRAGCASASRRSGRALAFQGAGAFRAVRGGGRRYHFGGPRFADVSPRLSLFSDHLRTVLAVKGSLRRTQQRRALDGSGPF
jgi:hypothetical protein